MTLKKSSRAGLVGSRLRSSARPVSERGVVRRVLRAGPGAAPRRLPRAPPPPPAPPPACDATAKTAVLEKCTPNSGDTAWMLTSVALVLMMTIPGLGLFYGGMVRKKNVRRHRDDELRHHLPGHRRCSRSSTYSLAFTDRQRLHRRPQSSVPARHPERHLEGHRQSESAGGDDPRDRLHVLPDDLRDHHAGADRRRLRRAHEVLGDAVVHRPVGDLRLRADRALGLGRRRLPADGNSTPWSRCSTSPAAPSCTSTPASPA